MKLVTYRHGVENGARLGLISGELVVDVAAFGESQSKPLPAAMLDLIDTGVCGLDALSETFKSAKGKYAAGVAHALTNVDLLAPIPRPRKNIFGIGLNYVEHVAESARNLETSKEIAKDAGNISQNRQPPSSVLAWALSTMQRSPSNWTGKWNWPSSLAPAQNGLRSRMRSNTSLAIQ